MSEMRELTDTEVEPVCGGVSDLGKYITKAVDEAISAAIGGNPGNGPGYPLPLYSPQAKGVPL
jgi:hypothetical protein